MNVALATIISDMLNSLSGVGAPNQSAPHNYISAGDEQLEGAVHQDLGVVHPDGVHATLTGRTSRGLVEELRNQLNVHADAVHDQELGEVAVQHDLLTSRQNAVHRGLVGGRGSQQLVRTAFTDACPQLSTAS